MRAPLLHSFAFILLAAVMLSGCSFPTPISKQLSQGGQASSPSSTPPAMAPSNDQINAIKAIIQRANEEQQKALEQHAPTMMQDAATTDYYQELVQTYSDLTSSGISDIKLIKIEWGQITLRSATEAEATTYETWRTTLPDGSTSDDRAQNHYTLISEQGAWKIQADDHPDQAPGPAHPSAPAPPGSRV